MSPGDMNSAWQETKSVSENICFCSRSKSFLESISPSETNSLISFSAKDMFSNSLPTTRELISPSLSILFEK